MSATTTSTPVVLEPASQAFVEATANPPFLYELTITWANRYVPAGRDGRAGPC